MFGWIVVVGNVMLTNNSKAHLCPVAGTISGRLLPLCSGPVVCCPVSILVLTKVGRVLVVSAPESLPVFGSLLNSKTDLKVGFSCTIRSGPGNLTRTFVVNRRFVNSSGITLVLKSGVFRNREFARVLRETARLSRKTMVFNCCAGGPRTFNIIRFSGR